jgi:hypothetical protein
MAETSPRPLRLVLWAAAFALAGLALPALAQEDSTARYDVRVLGIKVGDISLRAVTGGGKYALALKVQTSGLVGLLKRVDFTATSEGRAAGASLSPRHYVGQGDTGSRVSGVEMTYLKGVPVPLKLSPERAAEPYDVSPADQGGSLDPLTAAYALMRDVAPGKECNRSLHLFDGRRASQVTLGAPVREGDQVSCTGEYRRVAGYSPEELAERTATSFTAIFAPTASGQMRLIEATADSFFARAHILRN